MSVQTAVHNRQGPGLREGQGNTHTQREKYLAAITFIFWFWNFAFQADLPPEDKKVVADVLFSLSFCLQPRMDQYFNQMEKIIKERKTSSRIRFMIQDVIDLRRVNNLYFIKNLFMTYNKIHDKNYK